MTDTTNSHPPLPDLDGLRLKILAYGDARAAHAVAQIKARKPFGVDWCVQWLRNNYQDYSHLGGLCDAMLEAEQPAEPNREPNNEEVICPACTHQFRAIPVQVQRLLLDAGIEPPFLAATAPAPQTREIADAEIEVILCDEFGFDPRPRFGITRHNLRRIVRAAIALANVRG